MARAQRIDRRQLVDDAVLHGRAEIGGRRGLALGQTVAAVVLDDVNHRDVAPHQVHELPDADGAGIAVAAHADGDELAIGQQRTRRDRRHAAVDGIESVRCAQEICRALARAADARQLDDLGRVDAHLEERVDNALGDGVVAAAGAQRGLAAAIRRDIDTEPIGLLARDRRGCAHVDTTFFSRTAPRRPSSSSRPAGFSVGARRSPSCTRRSSVTDRASIGRPL